ncbi:MAG: hypothetical protein QG665_500 [Patescibacteria group bacterium]|nr:hypothetical protein [Patescibacteria group bacterium]
MKLHALEPGERVLAEVRHHWIFFSLELIAVIFLVAFPPIAIYSLIKFWQLALPENVIALGMFIYLVWLLLVWIYFFVAWTDYYLDVLIVTDRKIIDIDQKGIFHREVASFRLERIQNIGIETPGIFSTIFDYGHLRLETAGEQKTFELRNAANPYVAKDIIMAECEKNKAIFQHHKPTDGTY